MTGRKHRCGGTFHPAQVVIRNEETGLRFEYPVAGFVCDKCHEEVVDHKTLEQITRAAIVVPWFGNEVGTFQTRGVSITPSTATRLLVVG